MNSFTYYTDELTEVDLDYDLEGSLSSFEQFFNEFGVKYNVMYFGLTEERSFTPEEMRYIFPNFTNEDILIIDLGDNQYNFYCRQIQPINFKIKLTKTKRKHNAKKCNIE